MTAVLSEEGTGGDSCSDDFINPKKGKFVPAHIVKLTQPWECVRSWGVVTFLLQNKYLHAVSWKHHQAAAHENVLTPQY